MLKFPRKPSWPCSVTGRIKITSDSSQARPEQRPPSRDWRRILPGLAISALSLSLAIYLVDLDKLKQAVRLADYRYVLLAMLVTLAWLGVRGLVWRTLLLDKVSYSAVFWSLNEGYLINNVLPFRLGEVGRAFLLARKGGLEFWQVFSTVIMERLLDLAVAAGLLLSTLPFVVGATWAREAAVVVGAGVLVGFGVLYLLARNREPAMRLFDRLSARLPFLNRLGGKMVASVFSGLSVLTDGNRFLRAVGWMLLNWLVALFQYAMMVNAFFPGAKLLWAAFSLGVAALGIAAPSSPGAVGVLELSIIGALSLFGLDASTALALAITIHLIQYVITGLLGAYGLAHEGESLLGLYRRVRNLNVEGG